MTIGRNNLSKADIVTIAAIESGVPRLVEALAMIAEFQAMVRNKTDTGLAMWIETARHQPRNCSSRNSTYSGDLSLAHCPYGISQQFGEGTRTLRHQSVLNLLLFILPFVRLLADISERGRAHMPPTRGADVECVSARSLQNGKLIHDMAAPDRASDEAVTLQSSTGLTASVSTTVRLTARSASLRL